MLCHQNICVKPKPHKSCEETPKVLQPYYVGFSLNIMFLLLFQLLYLYLYYNSVYVIKTASQFPQGMQGGHALPASKILNEAFPDFVFLTPQTILH